jgi:hypothetical protein
MGDDDQPTPAPGWPQPPGPLSYGQPPAYGPPPFGPPAYGSPYGQATYPAPPGKKKRFGWLALSLAFIAGGLVSFAAAAGLVTLAVINDPATSPRQHDATPEGAVVPGVGDCLAPGPSAVDVTSDAQVVDCSEAHGAEVSAVLEVPGASHRPGTDDIGYFADDACLLAFQGYVGQDYDSSGYDYDVRVPSRAAWEAADRTVWCLVDADGAVGSVRNSRE